MDFPQKMHTEGVAEHIAANADAQTPVLIAGPTASGKSALALDIAETRVA